jgi:uncharacterized protein (TIGR03435 family)
VLKTNEHARELLKVTEMEGNAGKLCGYYAGWFAIQNVGMEDAAQQLEKLFGVPVLNETGRSELFDVSVKAQEGDLAGLKESLEKEAGLSLIEEERPAEMLVVEKE